MTKKYKILNLYDAKPLLYEVPTYLALNLNRSDKQKNKKKKKRWQK